jgi:hypothetical protein
MFRNAFVAGYRAVTGLHYYAPEPITTKEEVDSIMNELKSRTESHGYQENSDA